MHMFSLHDVTSIELGPIKQISEEPFDEEAELFPHYYRNLNVRCKDGSLVQIGLYTESPVFPTSLEVKEVK